MPSVETHVLLNFLRLAPSLPWRRPGSAETDLRQAIVPARHPDEASRNEPVARPTALVLLQKSLRGSYFQLFVGRWPRFKILAGDTGTNPELKKS